MRSPPKYYAGRAPAGGPKRHGFQERSDKYFYELPFTIYRTQKCLTQINCSFSPSAYHSFFLMRFSCLKRGLPVSSFLFGFNRRFRHAALLILAVSLNKQAQAQDSTLVRLVHQNQYDLSVTGTQFAGAGWGKLQQDIASSRFVLVGEDHGLAQIPLFTTAVAREFKPALYVAEVDKYQAQDLSRLAEQPGLPTAFAKQHPMALSFYSWAEEFDLIRYLRTQKVPIVGIDQVGSSSPGRFFGVLAEQVKSPSTKAYLRQRAIRYQAQDRAAMVTGKYDGSTMNALPQTSIDSLRTLTQRESPQVQQMVTDFVASYQIYQVNHLGKPGGHRTRINLMKRNLLAELRPYQANGQPLPKTLFKFGAYHVARGRSIWGDMYDVGSLAADLADAQDQKTLHILVVGKQGKKVGGANPDDFAKNTASYSMADEALVKPFMAQTKAGNVWQVFDLRPIRKALLANKFQVSSQELSATILGYDYVVIIPETTASHNF